MSSTINMPSEYETFIDFRSELLDKSEIIYGGRGKHYNVQKDTRKNVKKYINKTKKNTMLRKERQQLARDRFRERMNLPIGTSSIGFKGTKEMDERVIEIRKRFNL